MRSFSRSFTAMIGTLEESYLGTGRPLVPSRVLFELGAGPVQVLELRRRLDLDSGHLSRILRRLEADGSVMVARDPTDGRQRIAQLTDTGQQAWHRLDQQSTARARTLLGNLTTTEQNELVAAFRNAHRLLVAAQVNFEVVDPTSPVATRALDRYFAELAERFPSGFDTDAARDEKHLRRFRPPDGAFVVMTLDETPIGCGAVQRLDHDTSEIKRMWIDPDRRGLGLGARLLDTLESIARDSARVRLVLDTNATLIEAIAMYERAGYQQIERYNDNPDAHHWFEKTFTTE